MGTTLPAIETLLQEFYQSTTPNARKREIESELLAFKSQPNAWHSCLRVATTLNANQYLWFFCTSCLEHAITRRFEHLLPNDRLLLREALWQTYANLASVPRRQRDTFAQLIALMGKREFPNDDPNYIHNCIELTKTKFPLGINLLRITSEEITSTRKDVIMTSDRKNYFHSCISMCFPDVMNLITKYLLIAVCHINGKDVQSLPSTIMDYSLLATLPNDNQLNSSVIELLTCVQHLVSWIETDLLSEYFLMSILDLSQWRTNHQEISFAALSVLNELLYLQKPLPYTMTLISGVNSLLEQHNTIKQQNEMFTDKFREFLRLYTVKYWPKMINETDLMEKYLKSLYCCTVLRNGALDFTEKLEIWTAVIKVLASNSKLNRYNEILHQLIGEIMRRIQFENNKAELELLDNEIVEDNIQTEWQQFLTQCIECVALIAESRPNAVFAQVFSYWSRPHIYLISIQNDIETGKNYELMGKLKCHSFSEHLRDYSTICQAVVRVAPLLNPDSSDLNSEVNCQLQLLTEYLFGALHFFKSNKIVTMDIDKSSFQTDLDYLYAQVLIAICSLLPLSNNFKSMDILHNVFDVIGNLFLPNSVVVAPIIYMAASQLLLCISTVIRPKCLLEIPTIISLMRAGPKLTHLPKQVIANIYISLISYLVLPWKNVQDDEQDFPQRCTLLREYFECITSNFVEMDLNVDPKLSTASKDQLEILSIVISFFKDVNNSTKEILATIFKPIIMKALLMYNTFGTVDNGLAMTVADLSLSVLRSLPNQMGSQFIRDMITLFIAVNSREQLASSSTTVMEKILQMFQIIIEQPGSTSMSLLTPILDFTIDHRNLTESCDLVNLLCTLYDSILQCKWQYFYKSTVHHNGSLQHTTSGENLHPEHFMAIMNSYGHILVTLNDPNVVRTVLISLQNVNDRWRLYQRTIFKESLLISFQSTLINMLLSGEGALHFDLIANVLFTMGQVDHLKLRGSFAHAGFPVNLKALDEICLTNDIPTFSQKLTQLIQDVQCLYKTEI